MFTIKSVMVSLFGLFPSAKPVNKPASLKHLKTAIKTPIVLKHIAVMSELKKGFALKDSIEMPIYTDQTPTLSYLKEAPKALKPVYNALLEDWKKEHATFIAPIIENEKKYASNYYIFYHGQLSAFRVFQDFLKELYVTVNIHKPLDEFEFMRMWHEAQNELMVDTFIKKEEGASTGIHWWFDSRPDLMKNMMCVNLSLFGNMWWCGESSFCYFKKNQSAFVTKTVITKLFTDLFTYYGLPIDKNIEKLVALNDLITTKEGNLMQILVPKNKVDDYVYLSQPGGTPYRKKIDSTFNETAKRHTKISKILDQYIDNPSLLESFDEYQARVLLSKDCMLNPNSGVKIFRYTTVKCEEMKKYKYKVKQMVDSIVSQGLKKRTIKNLDGTGFGRLLKFTNS